MQPVDLARALLDLRLAIAREVAQLADRLGRHEAGLQQPRFGELAQPRRVRDVGLAARDLLDVAGVDQQALELVLQDRPRRLPIDAGGLHHHLRDAGAPASQSRSAEQAADRGRETPRCAARAGRARPARARTRSPAPCGHPAPPGARRSSPPARLPRSTDHPTAAQGPQRQTNLTVVLAAHSGAPGRPRTPNSKQAHRHQGKKSALRATPGSSPFSCARARPRSGQDTQCLSEVAASARLRGPPTPHLPPRRRPRPGRRPLDAAGRRRAARRAPSASTSCRRSSRGSRRTCSPRG